ncbi:splicing regulatory glutamine/lysine-rich protein 1 isoform X3 [Conger conger]|uniref:splicing regulatory glutamine/lysine-rich protein 1 isoform X3 n=1 Tax=Conger conger TaxID=82655 RepID=UPI002A59F042|nr:splicing regulatory glutamine/lysine-rich protein 1 isoform X3 [Conger conger]XP_061118863.1 splicing regulatory glutamine/lysine-rich protein 1 isoform X3 [Conger conger]
MVHDQYVSSSGKIPEEAKALSLLAPAAPVASLMPGGGLLPIPTPPPIQNLNIPINNLAPLQASLEASAPALAGVSSQPPLMGNVDPSKVDEIRRTVYVGNLNSQTTTAEQLLEYFKQVGDVKFVRMAGDETQPTRFAFVEFADQESVARALTFNGVMFGDRPLKINHSNNAIVKPPELTPQAAAKELEDVMKRVREAQSTIAAAIEPEDAVPKRSMSSSRRGRRSHSRSRSRSHSRRKRSHSKHRSRPSRQKTSDSHTSRTSHKKRSRSRDKRHSRSRSRYLQLPLHSGVPLHTPGLGLHTVRDLSKPLSWGYTRDRRKDKDGKTRGKEVSSREKEERRPRDKKGRTPPKSYSSSRRSRSTSRGHKKKSRSRSRSPRRKMRSPSPRRGKKDKKREKARGGSRDRSEREHSTSKRTGRERDRDRDRDRDKQERRARPMKVARDYDKEEKECESEREDSGSAGEEPEPTVQHNGSYSKHAEDTPAPSEGGD